MIKLSGVSKIFKTDLLTQPFVALENVSFEIPGGAMVGFLGANGAGKTTSLKIMMDFIRPSSGEVLFDQCLGKNKMEIFQQIGFLPERPYFYPSLKGREFLSFMGQLSGMNQTVIKSEISKWAPRFKIDHALERELKTYSKGMLQRIGFLASVIHHPKLVILDEPLSGLDPIGRKELKDVMREVHKEGKTVFFSTHIVSDVEEICDRVIFLKQGRLVYDGSVGHLLNEAQNIDFSVCVQEAQDFVPQTPLKQQMSLPGGMTKFIVSPEKKDELISELVSKNFQLQSLEMNRPSLEEIFYSSREKS